MAENDWTLHDSFITLQGFAPAQAESVGSPNDWTLHGCVPIFQGFEVGAAAQEIHDSPIPLFIGAFSATPTSLNVHLVELTQPGATGNQTISLAANFDPKAIILWTSGLASLGTGSNLNFGIGFGTYRGGIVQQRASCSVSVDASASSDTARIYANDSLLLLCTNVPARDLEIDLVSMQHGATSEVVINWVNLFTTASIKINCLVLGGSDITDALVHDFICSQGIAYQDVIIPGFDQPDFMMVINASLNSYTGVTRAHVGVGFAKKGDAGHQLTYNCQDADATSQPVGMSQRSNLLATELGSTSNLNARFGLDTIPGNWSNNGFRILYELQPTFSGIIISCLSLKGTFTAKTGTGTAPTSGGLPVVQNLNHGSVPKLGFVMGWNLIAQTGVNTTDAALGAFSIGAGDGTIELIAGGSDDDDAATSDSNSFWANTKVIRNYDQSAVLQSEADGLISGDNFELSWNDIDTIAREYQWFTLGNSVVLITAPPAEIAWQSVYQNYIPKRQMKMIPESK